MTILSVLVFAALLWALWLTSKAESRNEELRRWLEDKERRNRGDRSSLGEGIDLG